MEPDSLSKRIAKGASISVKKTERMQPAWVGLPPLPQLACHGAQTPSFHKAAIFGAAELLLWDWEQSTQSKQHHKSTKHVGRQCRERWRWVERWGWVGGAVVHWCLPNDMSASGVDGVGDEAHEADGAAAVDQVYAPLHLQCAHRREPRVRPC